MFGIILCEIVERRLWVIQLNITEHYKSCHGDAILYCIFCDGFCRSLASWVVTLWPRILFIS